MAAIFNYKTTGLPFTRDTPFWRKLKIIPVKDIIIPIGTLGVDKIFKLKIKDKSLYQNYHFYNLYPSGIQPSQEHFSAIGFCRRQT